MEIKNMTSLDIALICEGLIDQMQHEPPQGSAFKTWSKIAIQAFDWEPDEYMQAAKEVQLAADKRRGWDYVDKTPDEPVGLKDTNGFLYNADLFDGLASEE